MATTTAKQTKGKTSITDKNLGVLIGKMYSFIISLKLYHWHVTGKGSYAQHIALDQAIASLAGLLDRITETTYALEGDIKIVVPETVVPTDIVKHVGDFYKTVDSNRDLFSEDFSKSILDDVQETIQQLLYRLVRLQ